MSRLPSISIVIPTRNEERHLRRCLDSVFSQDYPKSLLEVLLVDDDSEDKTVSIAKQYPVKVLHNGQRHGEIGKIIGFKAATKDLFIYLDADNELISKDWLKKMAQPLVEDKSITGSFTSERSGPNSSAIERYLSFDSLQRDSLYQFLSPSVESTITSSTTNYLVCTYHPDKIPPAGRCMYRRRELLKIISDFKMYLELDFLVLHVRSGLNRFAFVPKAILYHHHVSSLKELIQKRKYNLTKVYFKHVSNNLYTWVNWHNPYHWTKLFFWMVYVNLVIPSLVVGILKSIKHKDIAGLYEPLVNISIANMLFTTVIKSYVSKFKSIN